MGKAKKTKVAGRQRYVLAANVRALVDIRFKESGNKPMAFAKAAGFSLSTAQRILNAATGPTMETIEAVAKALRVDFYRLFLPDGAVEVERRAASTPVVNPWLSQGNPDRRLRDRRSDGSGAEH